METSDSCSATELLVENWNFGFEKNSGAKAKSEMGEVDDVVVF